MARLLLSAAHKSSGKTTLSIGLCAALHGQSLKVQPFKKGPDYIDPMWLGRAAGRPCYNLDFYTQSPQEIQQVFAARSSDAHIALVEGNKGLYDGLDLDGSNSNAALAALLQAPVVLVLDTQGMTRGVAPLILGYQAFDKHINIAGVILNKVGGKRHESKLRAIIEHYTDVRVLGAVQRHDDLLIDERHLGLIPQNEARAADDKIALIARHVADQVDLQAVRELAQQAPTIDWPVDQEIPLPPVSRLRIGIPRDDAFGFYYPGDLEGLQQAGAELVFFDALHDSQLPQVDGLFIGGGFPETQMEQLSANHSLRAQIRQAIESGLPVYAECGGLMYLSRSLQWHERRFDMVGAIAADAVMHSRPQGRGYVRMKRSEHHPWTHSPVHVSAHEFHYAGLHNVDPGLHYAFQVERGHGIDGHHDGIVYRNVLAGFTHLRDVAGNHWTQAFCEFIRHCQKEATP